MTFDLFWTSWPANRQGGYSRKGAKSECLKRWNKHHHDTQAETILKHVAWLKTTPDWLKDNGLYIPAPHKHDAALHRLCLIQPAQLL